MVEVDRELGRERILGVFRIDKQEEELSEGNMGERLICMRRGRQILFQPLLALIYGNRLGLFIQCQPREIDSSTGGSSSYIQIHSTCVILIHPGQKGRRVRPLTSLTYCTHWPYTQISCVQKNSQLHYCQNVDVNTSLWVSPLHEYVLGLSLCVSSQKASWWW